MTETQHTRGPWTPIAPKTARVAVVQGRNTQTWTAVASETGIDIIADAPGQQHHQSPIAVVKGGNTQEEEQANACLIAAAPEMYAALNTALATGLDDPMMRANAIALFRAALAKADGR